MLTELKQHNINWTVGGESIILLLSAPFLLFPTVSPSLTAVFLLLLALSWLQPLTQKRPILPSSPLNLILLIWSLTFLIATLVTADPDLTLPKTTGLLLGFAIWRYLLRHINTAQQFDWAIWGFLLLGLGLTIVGTFSSNWLFKIPLIASLLQQLSLQFLSLPEAPSVGTHTNQLAATIIIFWPLAPCLLLMGRGRYQWPKAVWAGIGLTAVFTTLILILAQSRSSWLGAASSLGLLLLLWERFTASPQKRHRLRGSLAAISFAALLTLLLIGPRTLQTWWLEPPDESVVGSLESLNLRQEIWPWAVTALQDFPFTGIGLGSFRRAGPRLYPMRVPLDYDFGHAHNIFLQTGVDFGLLGLISYLALLLTAATIALLIAKQDRQKRPFALGLLAGLVALHIYGLADALAPGAKPGILLWYNIGLITALGRQTPLLHTTPPLL